MNALQKKDAIDWLAADLPEDEARVLSNVKFLTEGIDVPNLDAIIFFAPKQSQIDIVQAVGRIMRKYKDKDYGYIILPVVVPSGQDPDTVLDDNKTYKAVWQVLNALRSIDERFEASVNKLDLNKKKPHNLNVIGVGGAPDGDFDRSDKSTNDSQCAEQTELELNWHEIQNAIYGQIVKKVGDRRYLEDWTADVQALAERHIRWLQNLIANKQSSFAKSFKRYVKSLQHNINSDIDDQQAIEMLAQHVITKPIFEALFDQYSFVNDNPVSRAMEDMIQQMTNAGFDQEQAALEPFYESVRMRATGIDNAAAKQQFIITLYDKFFSTGFSATAEKLGIVFTPVEIVDFIVKSVDEVLKEHFGRGLAAENVHVLDPFTGTGTFITRTLEYLRKEMQDGKVTLADITRKYTQELHANEIVLLSYYIAAINIESVFDEINGDGDYIPFDGIVLTDTFESTENNDILDEDIFTGNNFRLKKQQEVPITAIISNPPYSGRQKRESDNNENVKYPVLDKSIEKTYVDSSKSTAKHAIYDSYIRAIRWSTDRLHGQFGVVGFITSNSYIDGQSMDGLRHSLRLEFNEIYIVNLKGSLKGKTKLALQEEGGNVFNIQLGVAMIILIKDGSNTHAIHYAELGRGYTGKNKLKKISEWGSISGVDFHEIIPNSFEDWINVRNSDLDGYPYLAKKGSASFFNFSQLGINTKRDKWVYGFSSKTVQQNIQTTIDTYNEDLDNYKKTGSVHFTADKTKISYSNELQRHLFSMEKLDFNKDNLKLAMVRPFTKKYVYFERKLIARPGKWDTLRPGNITLLIPGLSNRRAFSVFATNVIPDQNMFDAGAHAYSLYGNSNGELLEPSYSNINADVAQKYGLGDTEAMYYCYAVLHSEAYRNKFGQNLKKDNPRIPKLRSIEKYVEIGQQLLNLHINYEKGEPYTGCKLIMHTDKPSYRVKKMHFKSRDDHSVIKFNTDITIADIPERAYDYVVNGRSAIEWIMDQYQVKTDKSSQIIDDPNEYSDNSQYIFKLLLRVIRVSLDTLDLVNKLPKFEIIE